MRLAARLVLAFALICLATRGDAAGKVGVLLLHGKTGTPAQMKPLADALRAAGYVAGTPEMCWSKRRIYDRDFAGCMQDIDAAIGRLRGEGATEVVLGGASLDAVAALAYAAGHAGLAGVVGIVPAADPVDPSPFPAFAASLKTAAALLHAGKGATPVALTDLVTGGESVTLAVAPEIYESFHASDSPMSTVLKGLETLALPKITAPVLWVAANRDPSQRVAPEAFGKLPKNKLSQLATIDADHAGAPDQSASVVIAWLTQLGAKAGR